MRKVTYYAAKVAVAASLAVVASVPPAHAVLTISEDVSGTTFTCADNAACDTNPVVGQLALNPTTVNGVEITGNFERSTTSPFDLLSSNSTSAINHSGATRVLTASVSDTGFVGPTSSIRTTGSGTFISDVGNGITLSYFVDNANTQGANNPNDTPGTSLDGFSFTQASSPLDSFSHDFIDFEAQSHTPADRCVRFAVAVTDNYATLATGRPATALPVPVFHRLKRASFA